MAIRRKRIKAFVFLVLLQMHLQQPWYCKQEGEHAEDFFAMPNGGRTCSDYIPQKTCVSKETFPFIILKILCKPEWPITAEEPISPECCLGICLYRVGQGDYSYTDFFHHRNHYHHHHYIF